MYVVHVDAIADHMDYSTIATYDVKEKIMEW